MQPEAILSSSAATHLPISSTSGREFCEEGPSQVSHRVREEGDELYFVCISRQIETSSGSSDRPHYVVQGSLSEDVVELSSEVVAEAAKSI